MSAAVRVLALLLTAHAAACSLLYDPSTAEGDPASCPADFLARGGCYLFEENGDLPLSVALCASHVHDGVPAHLAVITGTDEFNDVIAAYPSRVDFRIGLTRRSASEDWGWVTGIPFDGDAVPLADNAEIDPSFDAGGLCAHLHVPFRSFYPASCSEWEEYLCEWDGDNVATR